MSRPELGPIAVGDEVFVRRHHGRSWDVIPATIVKIGRTWVTLRAADRPQEWRMRIDKQTTGGTTNYEPIFLTPAQLAYDKELAAARKLLDQHGISIRPGAILSSPEGTLMLAKILRNAGAVIEP